MSKKNEIIEVEPTSVEDVKEDKPTLPQGNYVVEIISEGKVIKKLAVANAEVNITRLAEGGMTVELQ